MRLVANYLFNDKLQLFGKQHPPTSSKRLYLVPGPKSPLHREKHTENAKRLARTERDVYKIFLFDTCELLPEPCRSDCVQVLSPTGTPPRFVSDHKVVFEVGGVPGWRVLNHRALCVLVA